MAGISHSQLSAPIFLVVLLFARDIRADLIDPAACKSTCGTRPPGGFGIPYEQAMTEDGRALELSSHYGVWALSSPLHSGPTVTGAEISTMGTQDQSASSSLNEQALSATRGGIDAQQAARQGGLPWSNVTMCADVADICWDCCSNDGGATCVIPCTFIDAQSGRWVNLESQCTIAFGGECLAHYCCRTFNVDDPIPT